MHLSFISNKQLVFNMCIGEYQTLIGPNRALWKKKNVKYKKLMFELFYQLLEYSHFNINFIYIKNFKNTFLLFLKYLKFINFIKILIKDTTHYTRIKLKKKTYIKRRISRKLNYINPLKM